MGECCGERGMSVMEYTGVEVLVGGVGVRSERHLVGVLISKGIENGGFYG